MNTIRYLTEWAFPHYFSSRYDLATSGVPDSYAAVPGLVRGTRWEAANGLEAVEEARALVASLYGAPPEAATLTFGGTQGLFMTAFVLGRPGEAVVVESPVYEPLYRNFEALGCEVRFLERREEDGFRLGTLREDAAALARDAACLVVTNPNNPSGAYDSREAMAALARAIEPAWLVVNEAYLALVPGGETAFGAAGNICVLSTLTKAYGIGTPRFGWIVAPDPLAPRLREAVFYLHGRYSGTVAALAVPVLENLSQCLSRATAHLRGRFDAVERAVARSTRVRWRRPPGMVTVSLATVSGVSDDRAFAEDLLRAEGVITAPGRYFRAPGTLRLSLGAEPEKFDEGLARFLSFAEGYRQRS